MVQANRSSLVLLGLAGLASVLFSLTVKSASNFQMFSVGLVYGVALAIYFAAYERCGSVAKTGAFVCACTAAYPAASLFATGLVMFVFPVNGSMGSGKLDIPMPVFFCASSVGAFIVIAAGVFVFGAHANTKSLRTILVSAIAGGILGVLGGGADRIRTGGTFHDMLFLYLIWQPGVAVLLGLALRYEKGPESQATPVAGTPLDEAPRTRPKGVKVIAAVFFACVLGFLGFLAYPQRFVANVGSDSFWKTRHRPNIDLGRERSIAEAPPMVDLKPIEPLPLEQVLILKEVGGLYPWAPTNNSKGQLGRTLPPAINYFVGYTPTSEPHPGFLVKLEVEIRIAQLPNAEWARYRVKYPLLNEAIFSPESLTKVTKFGQTIVQDTYIMESPNSGDILCFLWPSGNFAISVCYETPDVNEEFIRQYLEKYPSSL